MSMRPVYLQIGLQKTGTSYLQSIFWTAEEELARQSLELVPGSKRAMFNLMLDVRGRHRPDVDPPSVTAAVARLAEQLEQAPGTRALITEESLAGATPERAARLVAACRDREVHVVVTVRDLARQVPSAWQQQVRSAGTVGFDDYVRAVTRRRGTVARRFWNNQDLPRILECWRGLVPASRIHVVAVPPPSSPTTLLLERFCSVLQVDVSPLTSIVPPGNPSLGRVEAELLRRVNARLSREHRRRHLYGDVGKRFFSQQVLGAQHSDKVRLPRRLEPWCQDEAALAIDRLRTDGYDVVGDLDDLRPRSDSFATDIATTFDSEVTDAAVQAIATMLAQKMSGLDRQRRRSVRVPASEGRGAGRVRRRAPRLLRRVRHGRRR